MKEESLIDDRGFARRLTASDDAAMREAGVRFEAVVRVGYERMGLGSDLSLEKGEYARAVFAAAAESFLVACPIHPDHRLDPFVARVAASQEFPLTVLMRRGTPRAWEVFRARYEPFLRAAFAAGGRRGVEITALVEEVILELQGRHQKSVGSPIARYGATAPLKAWLFVFIRRSFGGGVGQVLTKTTSLAIFDAADDSSMGSGSADELLDDVVGAATTALAEVSEDDRRTLTVFAGGMRLPASDVGSVAASAVAQHALVNRLFRDVTTRVAGLKGWMQMEADRRLVERVRRRTAEHMRGIQEG